MVVIIDILDAPIKRIRKTCDLVDARDKFERLLPELEDFLEAEVARGVSSESQLTFDGLCSLKQAFARREIERSLYGRLSRSPRCATCMRHRSLNKALRTLARPSTRVQKPL